MINKTETPYFIRMSHSVPTGKTTDEMCERIKKKIRQFHTNVQKLTKD